MEISRDNRSFIEIGVIVMNRTSRAKQFLPFDALVGFQEALREKEIEYEDKKELTEESYEDLEIQLNRFVNVANLKILNKI